MEMSSWMKYLADDVSQICCGDFSHEDEDWSGHPVEFDKRLEAPHEEYPVLSVEWLAIKLSSTIQLFIVIFQQHGTFPELGKWVPPELCECSRKSRVEICSSFYSH